MLPRTKSGDIPLGHYSQLMLDSTSIQQHSWLSGLFRGKKLLERCWTAARAVDNISLHKQAFNHLTPDPPVMWINRMIWRRVRVLVCSCLLVYVCEGCCYWLADKQRLPGWHVWHLTDAVTSWRNSSSPPCPILTGACDLFIISSYYGGTFWWTGGDTEGNWKTQVHY